MTTADLLELLLAHHRESTSRINLVPSENGMSLAARVPYLTDALHRYSFGTSADEEDAWPGRRKLAAIEEALIADLKALFGAQFVNVRPISGINCMSVVLSAFAADGRAVFSIAELDGGHGSTRFIGGQFGLKMRELPYDPTTASIDLDALDAILPPSRSSLALYLDQFMCLFPHDVAGLRQVVGDEALIHYDGSHVMGLIAGGQFQDPLREGANSLGGSTHKSFPGPQKGVVLTNDPSLEVVFAQHASNFISHHHVADVTALAITTREMLDNGRDYAARVVANAGRFAQALVDRGLAVCYPELGYTRSHQVWVDIAPLMSARQASRLLLEVGVVVNAIPIPYLAADAGLRLGVQEVTHLGFDDVGVDAIADVFERVLVRRVDPARVRPLVADLLAAHGGARNAERNALDAVVRVVRSIGKAPGS